jgi:2-polyprenyl-6-methoxyphenol hydroxylase-like FAD-dependent oxidoreductase
LLVEKASNLRDDGYMIDFFGSGYDAAARLGLLPDLASIHYQIDQLAFVNARGRQRFAIPYSALRHRLFDDRHFNFLRGDLARILYARLDRTAQIRFGATVSRFDEEPNGVSVTLSDGSVQRVDLLVGADGVHSHIRHLAFGGGFVRPLGYQMAAFIVEQPIGRVPRNLFITLTCPGRQISVYPVGEQRWATLFLHTRRAQDPAKADAACDVLEEIYGDLDWVVPRLIAACRTADQVLFDAVEQVDMPLWSVGRVALVGDACWCVSPLAGQGASMAIAGAYVLAEELSVTENLDVALAGYERRLRAPVLRLQSAARRMGMWFVPLSECGVFARYLVTRVSTWPVIAPMLRRRLAAQSIFRPGGAFEAQAANERHSQGCRI